VPAHRLDRDFGALQLSSAVNAVFDHPVIQRCRQHKLRNVKDKLPDAVASVVEREMRSAYPNPDPLAALEELAKKLDRTHPGAAASLREGLAETLTHRLNVPPTVARKLHSTNPIESMIEICRDHAGMVEARKQFRRVNGHLHMNALRAALDEYVAASVTPPRYSSQKEVAA
jgi:transposase-like protein